MLNDFKAFLLKGNLLDLAIAVIMAGAFGKIVSTFTEGIVMPIVGYLGGGVDFKTKFIDLSGKLGAGATGDQVDAAVKAGAPLVRYGQLITDIVGFVIVGLVCFLLAKWAMGYFAKMAAAAPPDPPTPSEALLAEIRDLMAKK
jgi:large conductance mechanosensitive channel